MENLVKVEQRSVYGVSKLYPANDLASKLAIFKGQKTLTDSDVHQLESMGFKVVAVPPALGALGEL